MWFNKNKDFLARLLASENIKVIHKSVQKAEFQEKSRTLILPVLSSSLSEDIYDLMIGTGVGTALYGPNYQTKIDAIASFDADKKGKALKTIDILESIRTERLVRTKYPGLSKIFTSAYNDIIKNLGKLDYDSLSLVDRLNLSFKLGALGLVKFTPEEQPIVDLVQKLETFDDSVNAARKLIEYVQDDPPSQSGGEGDQDEENDDQNENGDQSNKSKKQKKDKNQTKNKDKNSENDSQDQDNENGDEKNDSKDDSQNEKDSGNENQDQESESNDVDENQSDSDGDSNNDGNEEKDSDGNPESQNSSSGNIKEKELDTEVTDLLTNVMNDFIVTSPSMNDPINGKFPNYMNPDWYIISYKTVLDAMKNNKSDGVKEWIDSNNQTVLYMLREFEMKKRAALLSRVQVAKTGMLDMNRVVHAMYSEDVFRRSTVVPEGKNHAVTIFVDWSGSMDPIIPGVMDQLVNQVMFLRRAHIPHEVYAFSDVSFGGVYKNRNRSCTEGETIYPVDGLKLIELFTDHMSLMEYNAMLHNLHYIKMAYSTTGRYSLPLMFQTGGTPLDSAIIASAYINDRIRDRSKAQILKTLFLTDGDSNRGVNFIDNSGYKKLVHNNYYLSDRKSGMFRYIDDPDKVTSGLIEFASKHSSADFYGFYLVNNYSDVEQSVRDKDLILDKITNRQFFDKNGFAVAKNFGFKEYYFIKPKTIENITITEANFNTQMKNRLIDRVLLSRFITELAKDI